ncbi:MAG: hypothetical protein ACRBBR_15795 [Cellvibrionaceae bacterium]
MIRVASVLALLSLLSQGIALAALPIITVFFSPEDFNHLAAFSSAALILITIAALRLEMAIPIVESGRDARILALTGTVVCIFLSFVVGVALWAILPFSGISKALRSSLSLLPLAVLFGGLQVVALGLALRQQKLFATGIVRLIQTIFGLATQIAIGYWTFVEFGLVIGFLVNILTGAVILTILVKFDLPTDDRLSFGDFRRVIYGQKDYVRYSSVDALLNTSGLQLPLFLISVYGEGATGGLLFLAIKLFYTPSTIVSGAFAKIYHSTVGVTLREGCLTEFTQEILLNLTRYGGGLVIAAVVLGPTFVELVMGPDWRLTGQLLIWMAPWIMLQLTASPIATVFMAQGKQKQMFVLSTFGFVMRISLVLIALIYFPEVAGVFLCVGSALFYLLVLAYASKLSGLSLSSFATIGRKAMPLLLATATLSYILKLSLEEGLFNV